VRERVTNCSTSGSGKRHDPARGSYLDNIVVYAYLTGVAPG
jgi:hypothetical protein